MAQALEECAKNDKIQEKEEIICVGITKQYKMINFNGTLRKKYKTKFSHSWSSIQNNNYRWKSKNIT